MQQLILAGILRPETVLMFSYDIFTFKMVHYKMKYTSSLQQVEVSEMGL